MSHIREGEIHTYLDGALDRLGESRAGEIRQHLDRCEDCRGRLEEERRVRDVAARLLDSGAPGSFETPPFEEILRRAEAGPMVAGGAAASAADPSAPNSKMAARRSLEWTRRWAWAASLVVALGTGWLLRGSEFARSGGAPEPSLRTEAQVGAVDGNLAEDVVVQGRAAEATAAGLAEADVAERGRDEIGQLSLDALENREQQSVTSLVRAVPAAPEAAGPPATVVIRDSVARSVDEFADARLVKPAEEPVAADEIAEVGGARLESAAASSSVASTLLAPGLAVIEISGDSAAVRVVQLFPEGDTIELEFVGVEGAAILLGSAVELEGVEAANAPVAQALAAPRRRADLDRSVTAGQRFASEIRFRSGAGLIVVRSQRPQSELEALLRAWGMLDRED